MPVRSSGFVRQGWPLAVASFATLLAGAAQAAEQKHGESGEGASFPPFDPAHFASNLFWLAITFAALYWLMGYPQAKLVDWIHHRFKVAE